MSFTDPDPNIDFEGLKEKFEKAMAEVGFNKGEHYRWFGMMEGLPRIQTQGPYSGHPPAETVYRAMRLASMATPGMPPMACARCWLKGLVTAAACVAGNCPEDTE